MGTHLQSLKSNLQKSFDHLNHHHGTNARTRQGYELLSSPIRPKGPKLAPTFQRRDRRLHHEALEERLQAFRHRCPDPRPVWSFPVQIRHRKQNPPSLESSRYGPRDPRRSLLLDQEGCLRPKAFGKDRKDKHGKFRLILIESRIHRLARYYKLNKVMAPTWKYDSTTASALVA